MRHDEAHLARGQHPLAVVIARIEQVGQQLLALADPPFQLLARRLGLAEGEILRPQLLEAVASDLEICVCLFNTMIKKRVTFYRCCIKTRQFGLCRRRWSRSLIVRQTILDCI